MSPQYAVMQIDTYDGESGEETAEYLKRGVLAMLCLVGDAADSFASSSIDW